MDATERMVLRTFKALVAKRLPAHRMTLFGSRARGRADPQSDADVLVVVDEPLSGEVRDYVSDCAWQAGFEHGIVVVPTVVTRDEWENGPQRCSLLAQAIRAEGIPI